MSVSITWWGHSAFLIEGNGKAVVVDPFLTGNPAATIGPEEVACTHVALTHGHEDHVGDTIMIAKANQAPVIAAFELTNWVQSQGHDLVEPANPGGRVDLGDGCWVALTQAFHSSSYEGKYMGMPCGLMIHMGGKTVYHCGDTGLFGDMKLLGEIYKPDVAIIPIGDRFTMGPELASHAADLIGAPIVIPCHYNTWPPIEVDVSTFAPREAKVEVLSVGASCAI